MRLLPFRLYLPLISIIVCSKVTFLQKKLLHSLGMFYIYLVSEFPFLRGLSRFEFGRSHWLT